MNLQTKKIESSLNFYNLKRNFTYMDDAGDETFSFLCNDSDTAVAIVVSYWLSHIQKKKQKKNHQKISWHKQSQQL